MELLPEQDEFFLHHLAQLVQPHLKAAPLRRGELEVCPLLLLQQFARFTT